MKLKRFLSKKFAFVKRGHEMGSSESKQQKKSFAPEIEDPDRLLIDSASLHCPICLHAFSGRSKIH